VLQVDRKTTKTDDKRELNFIKQKYEELQNSNKQLLKEIESSNMEHAHQLENWREQVELMRINNEKAKEIETA